LALLEEQRLVLLSRSVRRREVIELLQRAESLRTNEAALLQRYLQQEATETLELERLDRQIGLHTNPDSDDPWMTAASQRHTAAPEAASANLRDLSRQMLQQVKNKKAGREKG
jgi:hypothetical protein